MNQPPPSRLQALEPKIPPEVRAFSARCGPAFTDDTRRVRRWL